MTALKAAVAGGGAHLEECLAAEAEVERLALEAAALAPPETILRQLRDIAVRARDARLRLRAALGRP